MSEVARMLRELADRVLAKGCTAAVAVASDSGVWQRELWASLEEAGLPQSGVPEALGGAGASFTEALAVAESAGWHALSLPLVETILANWLLAQVNRAPVAGPAGITTIFNHLPLVAGGGGAGCRLTGSLSRVPWGRKVEHFVFIVSAADGKNAVACVPAQAAKVIAGRSIANEPRDRVEFDGTHVPASAISVADADVLMLFNEVGALARCCQMVGAMDWALAQTLTYCTERTQFGKPVGRFQAVQHLLAQLAGEVCVARVAVQTACLALDHGEQAEQDIASAKAVVSDAAGRVAAICHQLHGAMGYSQEHPLHLRTRRLWTWREEYGSERDWQVRIGRKVCSGGSSALWPELTGP